MSHNSDSYSSNYNKKIRRNKKLFYQNQRNDILNNLINFINSSMDGQFIFLIDLYNNQNLQKYIYDNIDNIKKYYRCSTWGYFVALNNNLQGDFIT